MSFVAGEYTFDSPYTQQQVDAVPGLSQYIASQVGSLIANDEDHGDQVGTPADYLPQTQFNQYISNPQQFAQDRQQNSYQSLSNLFGNYVLQKYFDTAGYNGAMYGPKITDQQIQSAITDAKNSGVTTDQLQQAIQQAQKDTTTYGPVIIGNDKTWQNQQQSGGGLFGDISSSITNALGPIGTAALSAFVPEVGIALTALNTANAIDKGVPLEDVAKSAAASYIGNQIGQSAGTQFDSNALGNAVGATSTGLLSNQSLDKALTSGAYVGAGTELANAVNASTIPSSSTTQPSSGLDYSAPSVGGLGLKAEMGQGTDLFGDTNSGDGLSTSSTLLGAANLSDMGGGQGLTLPSSTGNGTLGEGGLGNAWGVDQSPLEQNNAVAQGTSGEGSKILTPGLATSLLKALTGENTGTTGTSMATNTQTNTTNNANLGNFLSGLLGGIGGLMQGSTDTSALQGYATDITQAGNKAQSQSAFRPVGTTTTFGTSNFQINPTTGQLESAGYTLSPDAQAIQDAIMSGTRSSLQDVTALQKLGRGYLSTSPEAAAQQWYNQQQNILAPQREQQMSRLAQANYNQGTTGLRTGGTMAGGLQASNPLAQALANAWSQQDTGLLGQAQAQGRAATTFGQGLLTDAYAPITSGLTNASTLEKLGQQPLGLSTDLASLAATRGAATGQLGLDAATKAGGLMAKANQYNPLASILSGIGTSTTSGNALGNLFGNTAVGSSLGSWLSSLKNYDTTALGNAAADYAAANPDVIPAWTNSAADNTYGGLDAETRQLLGLD